MSIFQRSNRDRRALLLFQRPMTRVLVPHRIRIIEKIGLAISRRIFIISGNGNFPKYFENFPGKRKNSREPTGMKNFLDNFYSREREFPEIFRKNEKKFPGTNENEKFRENGKIPGNQREWKFSGNSRKFPGISPNWKLKMASFSPSFFHGKIPPFSMLRNFRVYFIKLHPSLNVFFPEQNTDHMCDVQFW